MWRSVLLLVSFVAAAYAAFPPGRKLPDIGIRTPTEKTIHFTEYRGKSLIVILISTTCNHCAQTVQILTQIQKEFAPRGLQVVGAAGDGDAATAINAFIARYRPNFPMGYLDQASFLRLAGLKTTDRPFVPIVMFVDRAGMVRVQYFGNDSVMKQDTAFAIRGTINALLQEQEASAKAAAKK